MSRLRIVLACGRYDRTEALRLGEVTPDGVDLVCLPLAPEETFFRMLRTAEFDVAEMSLSAYVMTMAEPEPPFIALPVFLSRAFRQSCVFVRAGAGIERPSDLRGRVVGVPEYHMTAAVWIRGILAEHYDLPVESVRYMTGGLEQAGRAEKLDLSLPAEVSVTSIAADRTLSELLVAGDIDAIYTARTPSLFAPGGGDIARLFNDPEAVEREYFQRTRVFPIMHLVALRRDVHDANPWVAQELCKAFSAARARALENLTDTAAPACMEPWLALTHERSRAMVGDGNELWPYGLDANRHVLETFLRYSHEQGLAARRYAPEELFAPQTLESFLI